MQLAVRRNLFQHETRIENGSGEVLILAFPSNDQKAQTPKALPSSKRRSRKGANAEGVN
jgi:hypothetical protein